MTPANSLNVPILRIEDTPQETYSLPRNSNSFKSTRLSKLRSSNSPLPPSHSLKSQRRQERAAQPSEGRTKEKASTSSTPSTRH